MTCPTCGGPTSVVDTRQPDCESIIRWRKCRECGHRFKTVEYELEVVKRETGKRN